MAKPVLLSEGFETPGYENSGWVETVNSGGTLDPAFLAESPDKGDYVLKAISLGADAPLAKATYELTDVINQRENDITAYIKVKEHNLTLGKALQPIVLTTAAGSKVAKIDILVNTNGLCLGFSCLDGTGAWFYGTPIQIETDKWYLIRMIYDIDKFTYKFKLNNKTYEKGDIADIWVPQSIRKLSVGMCYNNATAGASTIYIASVEWDD